MSDFEIQSGSAFATVVMADTAGEPLSEHLVRDRAKALGARDLFDVFRIRCSEGCLADKLRAEAPEQFGRMLADFIDVEVKKPIGLIGSSDLPFDIRTPDLPSRIVKDETVWQWFKNFFLGFSLVNADEAQIFIPVFCARPADVPGGTFAFTLRTTSVKAWNFKLGLPGLQGGFGRNLVTAFTLSSGEREIGMQLQSQISCLINTWSNGRGERATFVPLEEIRTREACENDPEYIRYRDGGDMHAVRRPHEVVSEPSEGTYEINDGCEDEFTITLPFFTFSGTLTISSQAQSNFAITHKLTGGYDYEWLGRRLHSHDVFVRATPRA